MQDKKDLCIKAKDICSTWWVDVLDCKVSLARQQIEMPFEDVLAKLKRNSHFVVIHRNVMEEYIEVGFSTMSGEPTFFLWINVPMEKAQEIIGDLKYELP